MICKKCGANLNDGYAFCERCGEPVNSVQNDYQQGSNSIYSQNNLNYGQSNFSQQQNYNQSQAQQPMQNVTPQPVIMPYSVDSNLEKVTTIGQYIGWLLLGNLICIIPVIGLIILIVLAVDNSNKNRANYFRSLIVLRLIVYVLAVIGVIVASSMGLLILDSIF